MSLTLYFDTETTGIPDWHSPSDSPSQPHIVQYCGILMDENHRTRMALDTLIRPEGFEIPAEAAAVHGITKEMAMQTGIPISEALAFHARLYAAADLIVGHNISFDQRMIRIEAKRLGLQEPDGKPQYCTMKNGTMMCRIPSTGRGGYKWPRLGELYAHLFGTQLEDAHDAMIDVLATAKCYQRMTRAQERKQLETVLPMGIVGTEAPEPAPAQIPAPVQAQTQDTQTGEGPGTDIGIGSRP